MFSIVRHDGVTRYYPFSSPDPVIPGRPRSLALVRKNEIRTDLVVCTVRMYVNVMFVGFDRSRWIQELDELDGIINENLEQILEQRRILGSLDVGREADLIGEFLEELLSARQMYIADRERLLTGSRC